MFLSGVWRPSADIREDVSLSPTRSRHSKPIAPTFHNGFLQAAVSKTLRPTLSVSPNILRRSVSDTALRLSVINENPTFEELAMGASRPGVRKYYAVNRDQLHTTGLQAKFRFARHPAAIRTGTYELAAQVGNVLADRPTRSRRHPPNGGYCADYTPISSHHGCERLSHDQPIVLSRP